MSKLFTVLLIALVIACVANITHAAEKPNVVLVFMDNFGYGELGCYGGGITRGAPTPRIDKLADGGSDSRTSTSRPSALPAGRP
ncbi:MAG: sulfatase-like hydrolase/transferase [Desulfobacterales bacterium]|nr:MAG: sulfatase-like hydrolase/transferase [Desulfobacterales bacterium]